MLFIHYKIILKNWNLQKGRCEWKKMTKIQILIRYSTFYSEIYQYQTHFLLKNP